MAGNRPSGGVDRALREVSAGHAELPRRPGQCVCSIGRSDRIYFGHRLAASASFTTRPTPHARLSGHRSFREGLTVAGSSSGCVRLRGHGVQLSPSHMRALHRRDPASSPVPRARSASLLDGRRRGALSALVPGAAPSREKRMGTRHDRRSLSSPDYVDHSWRTRIAAARPAFDPITHFHDLRELSDWYRSAGLEMICVNDTSRRGWQAHWTAGARAGLGVGIVTAKRVGLVLPETPPAVGSRNTSAQADERLRGAATSRAGTACAAEVGDQCRAAPRFSSVVDSASTHSMWRFSTLPTRSRSTLGGGALRSMQPIGSSSGLDLVAVREDRGRRLERIPAARGRFRPP